MNDLDREEGRKSLRIWVDADSCPLRIREIVCRAADRTGIDAIFVANRKIPLPSTPRASMVVVAAGEGVADAYIVAHAAAGDIAVTRDIPHAASLVENGVVALNDRGTIFTPENIRERLSVRDFMYDLRTNGLTVKEKNSFGQKEIALFAQAFDRTLTAQLRRSEGSGSPDRPGGN